MRKVSVHETASHVVALVGPFCWRALTQPRGRVCGVDPLDRRDDAITPRTVPRRIVGHGCAWRGMDRNIDEVPPCPLAALPPDVIGPSGYLRKRGRDSTQAARSSPRTRRIEFQF